MTTAQPPSAALEQLDNGDLLATVLVHPDGLLRVRGTPTQMQHLGQLLAPQTPQTPPTMPQPSRWQELWQWLLGDVL